MILVILRMKVLPEKCRELSQMIASLSGSIRKEKGCKRCDFCQSIEDETRLFLLEEWYTREHLMVHLKSKHYRVLLEAMNLLREPYERTFHTAIHPKGLTSNKINRPAMALEEVLAVIGNDSGSKYDPKVVAACLKLFKEKDYEMKS